MTSSHLTNSWGRRRSSCATKQRRAAVSTSEPLLRTPGERASLPTVPQEILDGDLIAHATAAAALDARVSAFASYQEALDDGFVADLQKQLMAVFRMGGPRRTFPRPRRPSSIRSRARAASPAGVKLESWLNTYTPPLASGGNVGVSGEVQDGVYAHIHGLSAGCSEVGAVNKGRLGRRRPGRVPTRAP